MSTTKDYKGLAIKQLENAANNIADHDVNMASVVRRLSHYIRWGRPRPFANVLVKSLRKLADDIERDNGG